MYNYKNNTEVNKEINVFTPYEGFINGTLFKPLYMPYKNYQPERLTANNEKDKAMMAVQMYYAGLHDLTLYLDVYPDDQDALKLRNEYYDKYVMAKKEYEMSNSPYTWDARFNTAKGFTYAKTPFQWEMKL